MTGYYSEGSRARATQPVPVITDARTPASKDLASRQKRYLITMGFRTLCFVAMIFVPGPFRWVLFGCAILLPYIAVLLANQANTRGQSDRMETIVGPSIAPQLTAKPGDGPSPGEPDAPDERVA